MAKKQKLDIVGYAGIIVHSPGGVLMTSGQPILADKRLLKAAMELIEHIEASRSLSARCGHIELLEDRAGVIRSDHPPAPRLLSLVD